MDCMEILSLYGSEKKKNQVHWREMIYGKLLQVKHSQHFTTTDPAYRNV